MPNPILWGGDISVQSRVEREEKRGISVLLEGKKGNHGVREDGGNVFLLTCHLGLAVECPKVLENWQIFL